MDELCNRTGIDPLHPMYAAERSVIVTLAETNSMVRRLDSPMVGVVIDVYHVWWDPEVDAQIAAASSHILGFHVCDWLVPTIDLLLARGMMGDGVIELRRRRGRWLHRSDRSGNFQPGALATARR